MTIPSTHWSLIGAVRGEKTAAHDQALETLARRYRRPAYQHLRARGFSHEDAEDLVQAFFADCLHSELFGRADRARGRFRSFFLTCLENFVAKSFRRQQALMRRPEGGFSTMDTDVLSGSESPETIFWRAYANDLTRDTLEGLATEFDHRGMTAHAQVFRTWFIGPLLDGADRPSQKALAATLGMSSAHIGNIVTTVKRSFRRALEDRIRAYAIDEADVHSELEELMGYTRLHEEN